MSATPNINGEKIKGSITGITLFSATTISGGTFYGDGSNLTGISDVFVTGFSYLNNTFTISQNSGSTFSSLINTMTGLTINGNLTTTGYTVVGGQFVSLGGTSTTNPTYRTSLLGTNISPRATFGVEGVGANFHRYSFDPVNQRGLAFTVANNGSVYIDRASIVGLGISSTIGAETGALVFKTLNVGDNSERMRINNLGDVGIGTSSPSEKLDVAGKTKTTNIQITSGATNGYVLTSDASGNGTWQQIPSFTGGTVSGATNFTNGLSANTISATTYQNLPSAVSYKVYTALLFQNSTNNPTVVVLENTIGTIVWTRSTTGTYLGTLSNAFPVNKVVVFMQVNATAGSAFGYQFVTARQDNNTIFVLTQIGNSTSTFSDGILSNTPIEIRVYP